MLGEADPVNCQVGLELDGCQLLCFWASDKGKLISLCDCQGIAIRYLDSDAILKVILMVLLEHICYL